MLRPPQKMHERLIQPGTHSLGEYTGSILGTVVSSSRKVWQVIYYYDMIPMDHKDELSAYLGLIGTGEITLHMYREIRDDLPHIRTVTKGDLITGVNRNIITLNQSQLGGRTFRPGDWLNVGNYCLKIIAVNSGNITIENMPDDLASLADGVTCSTVTYQIRAKKMAFDIEFEHISPNKYHTPPITFTEVV